MKKKKTPKELKSVRQLPDPNMKQMLYMHSQVERRISSFRYLLLLFRIKYGAKPKIRLQ